MNNRKHFAILFGLFTFVCTSVFAGNYSANGVATRAESMEAFTAVADDPSAVFYNPAGLTQIHHTEIDSGAALIMPDIAYTNSTNNISSSSTTISIAPDLFASTNKWQPIYFGVGVYAPFGRVSNYDVNPAVYSMRHFSKLVRIDFVPTVAIALNHYISLGVGIVGSRVDAATNVFGLRERGAGYGVTGQGGILVKLPQHVKLGFVYRGHETAHISGTGNTLTIPEDNFSLKLNFPATMSAGIAWQALHNLLFSATYDYEMWSTLRIINIHYGNPILNQIAPITVNAHNSHNVRFGMLYRVDPRDELRLGYAYINMAIPQQNVIPAEPDYSGSLYSVGYSHYFSKIRLDAGYEYGGIIPLNSTNSLFPGHHKGHLNTIMLGIAYTV